MYGVLWIVAWLVILLCLTVPKGTSATSCSFVYGEWTSCSLTSHQQTRSVSCLCQKRTVDLRLCKNQVPENTTRDCVADATETSSTDTVCRWKWTKWPKCTARCETGNTTRTQVCICTDGVNGPQTGLANEDLCDVEDYYGDETSACNEFNCDSVPSHNKIYWTKKQPWPMDDGTFNCTKSDYPQDSPKGQKYSSILVIDPTIHHNREWYYLAKEWIASQLNIASGAELLPESLPVVARITELLEYCDKIPATTQEIFTLKEKLGRINNNIGGLQNVDQQIAMYTSKHQQSGAQSEGGGFVMTRYVLMAIIIPFAVLILVVLVAAAVMYRSKKVTYTEVQGGGVGLKEGETAPQELQTVVGGTVGDGTVLQREQFDASDDEE